MNAVVSTLRSVAFSLLMLMAFAQVCLAVDVNTADRSALESMKGLGTATVQRILDERSRHGPFRDAADLSRRVRGLGERSVARLLEQGLTVGPDGMAPSAADRELLPDTTGAENDTPPAR